MTNVFEQEPEQDTQRGKFLTFYVGGEVYALEIGLVREIISLLPITFMPELPDYIKGIINLRGRVIPVVDVRIRFKKAPIDYDFKTCIIIIEVNDQAIGLIVDSVSEVALIEEENIKSPPTFMDKTDVSFVKAIGLIEEKIWLILDCEKLMKYENIDIVAKAAKREE
jgi:purine-binding chemotaxis protein CheW